jgi:hypothetical protein
MTDMYGGERLTLLSYLMYLDGFSNKQPDQLVLPDPLADRMRQLYQDCDLAEVERGFQLMCDRKTGQFTTGPVCNGDRKSVNITATQDPDNFGDVHAHPTTTFGYFDGYPAHSPQDLRDMALNTTRRFFFKFVVSGEWIYAMVDTGDSTWNDQAGTQFLDVRRKLEEDEMSKALDEAGQGEESYTAMQLQFKQVREYEEGLIQAKKLPSEAGDDHEIQLASLQQMFARKAKLGQIAQSLTVECCTQFAKKFNYLFYAGKGSALSRITPDTPKSFFDL